MAGVSLINSLGEKWCMGLLSRQSGWKEKSQPGSSNSLPSGLFLATCIPLCSLRDVLVAHLGDCCWVHCLPGVWPSEDREAGGCCWTLQGKNSFQVGKGHLNHFLLWTPDITFIAFTPYRANTCPPSQDKLSVHSVQCAVTGGMALSSDSDFLVDKWHWRNH